MDAVTIMVWVVIGTLGACAAGVYHLRRLYKAEMARANLAERKLATTEDSLECARLIEQPALKEAAFKLEQEVDKRDKRVSKLEVEIALLERALHLREDLKERAFNVDAKVKAALAAMTPENPLWRAVLQIIHDQHEDEVVQASLPNLTDSARHYNCGRAAALDDIQLILTRSQEKAQREQQQAA